MRPQNSSHDHQMEAYLAKQTCFTGCDKPGLGEFMLMFAINTMVHGARENFSRPGKLVRAWSDRWTSW